MIRSGKLDIACEADHLIRSGELAIAYEADHLIRSGELTIAYEADHLIRPGELAINPSYHIVLPGIEELINSIVGLYRIANLPDTG